MVIEWLTGGSSLCSYIFQNFTHSERAKLKNGQTASCSTPPKTGASVMKLHGRFIVRLGRVAPADRLPDLLKVEAVVNKWTGRTRKRQGWQLPPRARSAHEGR